MNAKKCDRCGRYYDENQFCFAGSIKYQRIRVAPEPQMGPDTRVPPRGQGKLGRGRAGSAPQLTGSSWKRPTYAGRSVAGQVSVSSWKLRASPRE